MPTMSASANGPILKPGAPVRMRSISAAVAMFSVRMRCDSGTKRAADVVDEERRAVGAQHRLARHAAADRHHGVRHPRRGLEAGDDLDQPHQRHRIEEVHAADALGVLALRRDRGDRERGGVRRDDGLGPDQLVELGEQRLLGVEPLDDGLDDDVGLADVLDVLRPRRCGRWRPSRPPAGTRPFSHQAVEHLGDVVLGGLRGARLLVVGDDAHAALGGDLHDAAAHGARADHADRHIGCIGIEGHARLPGCRALRKVRRAVD